MSATDNRVYLKKNHIENTYSITISDTNWDVEKYAKHMKVKVMNIIDMEMQLDFVNVDAPFVNAIRRILLAEVPTMAIEKVHMFQNTGVIADEVFAHRLGLLPIKADPRQFQYRTDDENSEPKAEDTLIFELKVKSNVDEIENERVCSSALEWKPIDGQEEKFKNCPPKVVHPDILLAVLKSGQEIECVCHCTKGIGRDHAKFSPVATASYRFLPELKFLRDFYDEEAKLVQSVFSKDVVCLIKCEDGSKKAVVSNPRAEMCSRNFLQYPQLADSIQLSQNLHHIIFNVESVGQYAVEELIVEAINIMINKCNRLLEELDAS